MSDLRILSYNIRFGGRERATQIAEVIQAQAPDLVVLQEATDPQVVRKLAERTGLPDSGERPGHSLAFLGRRGLVDAHWEHPQGSEHAFLNIRVHGEDLRVVGVHLRAVLSRWTERRRQREAASIIRGVKQDEGAEDHVLIGDFNAVAPDEVVDARRFPWWLRVLFWLSGRQIQRWAIGDIREAGYLDAFRHMHPDVDGHTFPSSDPHIRLDYAFVPPATAPRVTACHVVKAPPTVRSASDHLPLALDLARR